MTGAFLLEAKQKLKTQKVFVTFVHISKSGFTGGGDEGVETEENNQFYAK